jgi:hypothetical protein
VNSVGVSDWATLHLTNGTTGSTGSDGLVIGLLGDGNAQLFNYENTAMVFSTNATERARISSDGTFRVKGAGTAGSTDAFQVAGTAPADAARIDSSGNLLVGTTNTSPASSNVVGLAVNNGGYISVTGSGTSAIDSNRTNDGIIHAFRQGGTLVGSVSVTTTATAFNTSSDYRLKENIQDAESASTLIDSLQVRQYDWKLNGTHQRYGFIAQELVTVAPEAVYTPTDPEEMMAVDYSKLVPMLVKEIQSLRKRLAAAGIA